MSILIALAISILITNSSVSETVRFEDSRLVYFLSLSSYWSFSYFSILILFYSFLLQLKDLRVGQ